MSDLPQALTARLKKLIEAELDELEKLIAAAGEDQQSVELDQQRFGRLSRIDALQGQAMAIASGNRRAIRVESLKAALVRMDQDEYGYCARCNEPISAGRLEADPAAMVCVACASSTGKAL